MSFPKHPDAKAAFDHFLPAAQALPEDAVLPYRLDADLCLVNIGTAMKAFGAYKPMIKAHLPKISIAEVETLPALGLAHKLAAMEAERSVPSEKVVSQNLIEARRIRGVLLPIVTGLGAAGLVPQSEVDDILRGRGPRDVAEDCVALGQVFVKHHKAIKGKHAADPEMIKRAGTLGSWLLQNLRTANAPAEKAPPPPMTIEVRNRMGTLLVRRYGRLQVIAHYFEGDDHERSVPPLMSRQAARAGKDDAKGEGAPEPPAGGQDVPAAPPLAPPA
ncbi:MAG: hypothetical protein U0359_19035 [Byssovorax sp.]